MSAEILVAGVDEVGRGPLAGPVVAAAVILDAGNDIQGLADSKKLSPDRREQISRAIRRHAHCWALGRAEVAEIDDINILNASLLAMQRAVGALRVMPTRALIDGNRCPALACPVQAIVKGDDLEPAISAASIVAKVARDQEMCRLDDIYPGYGFARHKGYGTAEHVEALNNGFISEGPVPLD